MLELPFHGPWLAQQSDSAQPHLHLQVTDSPSWSTARGLPMAFRCYRRPDERDVVRQALPNESEIVEPA